VKAWYSLICFESAIKFQSQPPIDLSFCYISGPALQFAEELANFGWWKNATKSLFFSLQVLSPPVTSQKQRAPPRPVPSAEASRRLSAGVQAQQSAVTPSYISSGPANVTSVPPVNNNNVIYSNSNEVDDFTDDEWDDSDEDEEIQVSKTSSIMHADVLPILQQCYILSRLFLIVLTLTLCEIHRLAENFCHPKMPLIRSPPSGAMLVFSVRVVMISELYFHRRENLWYFCLC